MQTNGLMEQYQMETTSYISTSLLTGHLMISHSTQCFLGLLLISKIKT
jgi:hypothetical protein